MSLSLSSLQRVRVGILAVSVAACGGSANQAAESVPAASPALIDPALATAGAEFSRRLAAIHGTLQSLRVQDGAITVKWTSVHCEMAEAEVIDFLVSLNQGHPARLPGGIVGERTCDGSVRAFTTSVDRFEEYRTGRINDREILTGLR